MSSDKPTFSVGSITFSPDERRLWVIFEEAMVRALMRRDAGYPDLEAARERRERDRETKARLGKRNSPEAYKLWKTAIEAAAELEKLYGDGASDPDA
jgi:hypothetical protein